MTDAEELANLTAWLKTYPPGSQDKQRAVYEQHVVWDSVTRLEAISWLRNYEHVLTCRVNSECEEEIVVTFGERATR